ncbi:MAG: formylglycine-generating enzyme family protein [Thermoanaerobaculia bacterium]|nr:formylglycine-generating enzyme family protein [Thermoanaerobaculia bacterium]
MKKWILVLLTVLVSAAFGALLAAGRSEREREARRAAGETALVLQSVEGTELALSRCGNDLDSTGSLLLGGAVSWLPAGRYFLTVTNSRMKWFYPVRLDPARGGPDLDRAFAVTVRRPPAETPPRIEPEDPPFAFIPAGHFEMGERSNPDEPHPVWVTSFFLGSFEVTNREFRRFLLAADGYDDRRNWTSEGWEWKRSGTSQVTARLLPEDSRFAKFGGDDLPTVLVTWWEANAYARWLTRTAGKGRWLFRLAAEAEWEKAARGPDSFEYGLGMKLSEPEVPLYNWKKNPGAEVTLAGWDATRKTYRPNRFGLYHASGNAAEWLQSAFRPYNRKLPYQDDDRNLDEAKGTRTTRGGSWYSATTSRLALAYREDFPPNHSSDDLGFRLAAFPLP